MTLSVPSPAGRILIVSNGALCRNPRVLKEATALGKAGYAVTVLTVRNHAASEEQDIELLRGAPFAREVVDVLAGGGAAFRHRLLTWFARKSGRESPHALGPAGPLLQKARARSADLTIVHNEVAHYVGTRLMDEGRRVAADIEDWHSEDLLPQDRIGRPLALLREVERTLLHRCVHTTTTSEALASALQARYGGKRPEVITNSFPLQPTPNHSAGKQPPAFFWFSQTLGPGRGLEAFLAAWATTQNPSRVVLLGEARNGYDSRLLGSLPPARRGQISFRPLVSPGALPAVIAEHDIGLALEDPAIVNRDLTITNKILQYLNAGLAVVASATAGQREVLARGPDAGIIVAPSDTAASARALDALLADPVQLTRRQQTARKLAETAYSWEREAPRLLSLVATALQRPILDRASAHIA